MIDSTVRSDGQCSERAGWLTEPVVERDAGCERKQFAGDASAQTDQRAGAVVFEAEAVFERPENRLDALRDAGQMQAVVGLGGACGAQNDGAEAFGGGGGEIPRGVALVADDRCAAAQREREQPQRDIT